MTSSRLRALSSGRPPLARILIGLGLAVWAIWAMLILTSPLKSSNLNALIKAEKNHDVRAWAFVSHNDRSQQFAPAMADPMSQGWNVKAFAPRNDSGMSTSSGDSPQIAWRDSHGVHVTNDFFTPVNASGAPQSPSDAAYQTLMSTYPNGQKFGTARELWSFGDLSIGAASHLKPFGIIATASFIMGLVAIRVHEPRYRTRWGWFWILGLPMGFGFVWMLLREGWFGLGSAPKERASGGRSFVIFLVMSVALGAGVQALINT